MKLSRLTLVTLICEKVGISQRVKPDNQYLSKRELSRISNYIDLGNTAMKRVEILEGAAKNPNASGKKQTSRRQ